MSVLVSPVPRILSWVTLYELFLLSQISSGFCLHSDSNISVAVLYTYLRLVSLKQTVNGHIQILL